MTGRERMLTTLDFKEPDRPPHFEVMFELEHEAFGLDFPDRNSWAGMSPREKEFAVGTCMDIYSRIIDRFSWDALAVYWPWSDPDGVKAAVRDFGESILIGGMCGGGVWSIDSMDEWDRFSVDLIENRSRIHERAELLCAGALEKIDTIADTGADFVYMPNDVAFNAGPFISPTDFAEIVEPYWRRQVERTHEHGMIAFVHTDGQIMPILDSFLALGADVIQSIDPMAGVDIAEVKRLTYRKIALQGNVQCNLLQDGPLGAIRESAEYCLKHAAPGGGYIYGTSNTIFPGMPLEHYEFMLEVFRDFYMGETK
jgi:uroporphyrinogen decarboxylase